MQFYVNIYTFFSLKWIQQIQSYNILVEIHGNYRCIGRYLQTECQKDQAQEQQEFMRRTKRFAKHATVMTTRNL